MRRSRKEVEKKTLRTSYTKKKNRYGDKETPSDSAHDIQDVISDIPGNNVHDTASTTEFRCASS